MSASSAVLEQTSGDLLEIRSGIERPRGKDLFARTSSYLEWQDRRCRAGLCPYPNSPAHAGECGDAARSANGAGLDFASRDPLGLALAPEVRRAAADALDPEPGSHLSRDLEAALGEWLGLEHVVLFESGFDARFHAVESLVHDGDFVVLDSCVDPTFEQAAREATPDVVRHAHLDVEELRAQLCEIRARSATQGILVVTQSLFPLESDGPDLTSLQGACRENGARLLVDASHDLGVLGPEGTGAIGVQGLRGRVDLVLGSLAPGLACNVGFLATGSREAAEFVKFRSGVHVLMRQPSPLHCAVAVEALRLARTPRCDETREAIRETSHALRKALDRHRVPCLGQPSPYVDVHLGWEGGARLVSSLIQEQGVRADLIEHPLVSVGAARLCLQVPGGSSPADAEHAAAIIGDSIRRAWEIVARA